MILPDTSLPILEPSVAVVTYQARTSALVEGVVNCDRTDLWRRQGLPSHSASQHLLLYASERPKVSTCHTDHPQNGCKEEDPEIFEDCEGGAA